MSCEPENATSGLTSLRKGEGAFRLRPREPLPPRPLDKYQLRETKRRLLQRLGGGRLTPRACAHWFPLRQDPFCGEQKPGTPSRQPRSAAPRSSGPQPLSALCPAPGRRGGVGGGLSRSRPTFRRSCSPGYSFSPPPPPPQRPASPCDPHPAAPAPMPRPFGSSGCRSPSSGCVRGDAVAPSPGGPPWSPFSVLLESPCTGGEAAAPTAACRRRLRWPWTRPRVRAGRPSRTGAGPGVMGCLTCCVWI